ncbi:hypothetical protein D3C73_1248750 [compost metagenome]
MKETRSDKRILQALNTLWNSVNTTNEIASTSESVGQSKESRAKIIDLLSENVGITRTELAKKHSHSYYKI